MGEEESFAEEFRWYSMLYIAAKEDFLKISEVTKQPVLEFLTFMNFYVKKTELDAKRIQRATKNNY